MDTPRVWVGCLGCYNGGALVGEWFDATDAPTEMGDFNQTRAITNPGISDPTFMVNHVAEAHEELWVFDHENFGGMLTGECSPGGARELAEVLDSVAEPAAFAAYVAHIAGLHYAQQDWSAAKSDFEDCYAGEWDSEKAFVYDECGHSDPFEGLNLPDDHEVRRYFDWQSYAEDLFVNDYSSTPAPGGGVYVFRSV